MGHQFLVFHNLIEFVVKFFRKKSMTDGHGIYPIRREKSLEELRNLSQYCVIFVERTHISRLLLRIALFLRKNDELENFCLALLDAHRSICAE